MDNLHSAAERRRQLENIRLAVGLAHTVVGTELTLQGEDEVDLRSSGDTDSDIHICRLRQVVVASLSPQHPDVSSWIRSVTVGGALTPSNAGVYRFSGHPLAQRWFATVLPQTSLVELLERVSAESPSGADVEAVLKPDPGLEVTVVGISATTPAAELAIDELSLYAYQLCLTAELLGAAPIRAK